MDNPPEKAIVRRSIPRISAKIRSGYSESLRKFGYRSEIQLLKGERMRDRIAVAVSGTKALLEKQIPGIQINAPELFPISHDQCVLLITGWKPETILVS